MKPGRGVEYLDFITSHIFRRALEGNYAKLAQISQSV